MEGAFWFSGLDLESSPGALCSFKEKPIARSQIEATTTTALRWVPLWRDSELLDLLAPLQRTGGDLASAFSRKVRSNTKQI